MSPVRIRVGEVEFELGPVPVTTGPKLTAPTLRSLVEEYGGPQLAKLLTDQPDLVDDDEQPAVRSS